ncbi:PFGI-1 class ICE element type IV pilus protein PilL2 [Pseudomonas aeruginosa]|jgi:type IV pili sensor histidine kinase/response regulator|uniref:PFGI-1 class ICE element type IV pilus protein PilL2 n=1 Tax=Pseudomonas aeruginosa TaxID=287 RepID=UPI001B5B77C4|nr:PilL N-terminal domain-containing protein [Achromobacter xylosoxidans]MBP7654948.1 PilL N-terminal domain-containing protein [Pseudoxanthomonas sp.]MCH4578124.1 PilL N-terminal domain-containing protein [Achromobacter xylosoxidans]
MQAICPTRRLAGASLLAAAVLTAGCATTAAPVAPPPIEEAISLPEPATPELVPVVRYGRYTLVELAPTAAQRDLLLQVVDVVLPEDVRATVGDGLRHVLMRSGYQLCETAHAVIELYSLPLPAAHLRLGPLTLRDALLTLAGPAWDLQVDDRARQVCFVGPVDTPAVPAIDMPAPGAVETFPLVEGAQP